MNSENDPGATCFDVSVGGPLQKEHSNLHDLFRIPRFLTEIDNHWLHVLYDGVFVRLMVSDGLSNTLNLHAECEARVERLGAQLLEVRATVANAEQKSASLQTQINVRLTL